MVVWTNYSYGFEGRLGRHGRPFARVRQMPDGASARWELVWLVGPRLWSPLRAQAAVTLQRQAEAYAKRHAAHILAQMPPDPMRCPLTAEELDEAFWPGFGKAAWREMERRGR